MGTTAEKGQRVLQSIAEVQEGINNLGGNLTDQTPFKNFRAELDNIYNNLPKTSYAEGSNITLSNTLKGKLDFEDGIVGYGDTSQKSYEGYNLLDIKNTGVSTEKATYTKNTTGYTINTNSQASSSDYGRIVLDTSFVNSNDNFAFSLDITSNVTGNIIIGWVGSQMADYREITANTKIHIVRTFNGMTTTAFTIGIYAPNTTLTVENLQIYKGTTEKNYEPYTGGQASPNPSYPQDIEVVRGKNLFDGVIERGSIVSGQNVNDGTAPNWRSTNYIKVSPNTGYAFSVNSIINRIVVSFYTSNKTWINRDNNAQGTISANGLFTTPSNCEYIRFRCYQDDYNLFENGDIMLEKGSTATSYLPYNTLEVKIQNKNLCTEMEQGDVSTSTGEASSYQPTTSGFIRSKDYIPVKPSEVITVSYKNTATSSIQIVIFEYNANKTYIGFYYSNASTYTRTLGNETAYIKIRLQDTTNTLSNNTEIQVEYGNTKTSYVEHQEQIKQLSLGNYKPSKIGNYVDYFWTDRSTKKWYFHEAIGKVALKSTLGWNTAPSIATGTSRFFCNKSDVANLLSTQTKDVLSNYFIPVTWNEIFTTDTTTKNAISDYSQAYTTEHRIVIRIESTYASTVNELNTYLDSHDIYAFYILQTPTDTEITDTTLISQLEALYNSHSFTGTTIIEIDGQLPLIIKVRALKGN